MTGRALWIGLLLSAGCGGIPGGVDVAPALGSPLQWDAHTHSRFCGDVDLEAEIESVGLDCAADARWSFDLYTPRAAELPATLSHALELSKAAGESTGHLLLFDVGSLSADLMRAQTGEPVVAYAHEQGGLVGMAHGQATEGTPDGLALFGDRLDFIGFDARPVGDDPLSAWDWWAVWEAQREAGRALPVIAGSDFPCTLFAAGSVRTYVFADTPDDIPNAIRGGRTVATVGAPGWALLRAEGDQILLEWNTPGALDLLWRRDGESLGELHLTGSGARAYPAEPGVHVLVGDRLLSSPLVIE